MEDITAIISNITKPLLTIYASIIHWYQMGTRNWLTPKPALEPD